jgi:hypothetical protein
MPINWEDSSTYRMIFDRGVALGYLTQVILRLGAKRFGSAPAEVEAAVRGVTDRGRLERIADRLLDAASWAELVATA